MNNNGVTTKARMDMKIDNALKEWVQDYARRKHTSVSSLVRDFFIRLKQFEDEEKHADGVDQI